MTQSSLHATHIRLYISLTRLWLEHLDQMHQIEEFPHPKHGAPSGHDVEGILGDKIGPVRRQRAQAAAAVMEPGSVLVPVLATHDQIKFLAEQRMVWVRYPERSALNVTMRRS